MSALGKYHVEVKMIIGATSPQDAVERARSAVLDGAAWEVTWREAGEPGEGDRVVTQRVTPGGVVRELRRG